MASHPVAHGHSASSPPLLPSTVTEHESYNDASDIFAAELSPSRQQKLLQSRNARFPAKKLSISGLSSKLSQLINNNEQSDRAPSPTRNQENRLHKSRSAGTIGRRTGLGILNEISNTTKGRSTGRRHQEVSIYEDNPSRPLLQTSPLAGSSPYADAKVDYTSPLNFDHIHDSLNTMRVRNVSLNDNLSSIYKSPASIRLKQNNRALPIQFDSEDYIEHIERELQQVRDEAYSPLTRRPLKEKLRAVNKENDRLQQELASLKEKFETDVKKTVEHKTMQEVELKRRIRDLEDALEDKDHAIRDLQYQHEERRLDTNIIETLRAQIDRLEQDKADMEEINLSMSKRNEVLSQLLAMSPTKGATAFSTSSPTKEKRSARPMSLILPKIQSSPKGTYHVASVACSPRMMNSAEISPLKLSPESSDDYFREHNHRRQSQDLPSVNRALRSPVLQDGSSRRSTMLSSNSISGFAGQEEGRIPVRRKARRFVAGSTQLKPLLLPALTGEGLVSASTASSPRSWSGSSCFAGEQEETILPADATTDGLHVHSDPETMIIGLERIDDCADGPGPACDLEPVQNLTTFLEPQDHVPERSHIACASLQTMPMPSTPDSLVALPAPLFSPTKLSEYTHENTFSGSFLSVSPITPSEARLNMRKRRQQSLSHTDLGSPRSKFRRSESRPSFTHGSNVSRKPRESHDRKRPKHLEQNTSLAQRLQNIRSTDNVAEILRRKDFAVKPLASLTIRTVYKILATCAGAIRDFRKDPFSLARRVLANAWYMNWKMLGKMSWWVLGLFVYPQEATRARPAIDWDQYDGESIASRYCSDSSKTGNADQRHYQGAKVTSSTTLEVHHTSGEALDREAPVTQRRAGWTNSLFLWGKFSAAMMLAVTGAIVHGPGDMLKDVRRRSLGHNSCKSCSSRLVDHQPFPRQDHRVLLKHDFAQQSGVFETSDFDFRSETQLDSSSILAQIQQPAAYDSTLRPRESPRKRVAQLFSPIDDPQTSATEPD